TNPARRRTLLERVGHQQWRQRRRESSERAALAAGARLAPLHQLPAGVVGAAGAPFPEQIRVTPPHFLFERARHDLRVELRALFGDYDLKREMEQHVAQLVAHRFRIIGLNGGVELEDFLDQVRAERLGSVRAIPWAALPQLAQESQSRSES